MEEDLNYQVQKTVLSGIVSYMEEDLIYQIQKTVMSAIVHIWKRA